MLSKARPPKRTPPAAAPPLQWSRADPAALAAFDPTSKTCTMNCGKHAHDPRSYTELKFMCDDCDCHEPKGTPAMSNWIKCTDRLPECPHECTTDDTMVSHTVLVTDERDPTSLGMAHMREDGTWKLYGGDHDFMHVEAVTHWQPLPKSPFFDRPKIRPAH